MARGRGGGMHFHTSWLLMSVTNAFTRIFRKGTMHKLKMRIETCHKHTYTKHELSVLIKLVLRSDSLSLAMIHCSWKTCVYVCVCVCLCVYVCLWHVSMRIFNLFMIPLRKIRLRAFVTDINNQLAWKCIKKTCHTVFGIDVAGRLVDSKGEKITLSQKKYSWKCEAYLKR
jgi:hypothetical protein